MTAGDLIRGELDAGTSQLALAKRLAGSDDDTSNDVKRWRFVVRRAAKGAEPQAENMARIAELFEVPVTKLERPDRAARRASLEQHLESLAADSAEILENQVAQMALLQEIRESLGLQPATGRTVPKRTRRRAR